MGKTKLFVFGASGHGKVVADIAALCGYDFAGYIDDNAEGALSYDDFLNTHAEAYVALGIGNNDSRANVYRRLKDHGTKVATLIHPAATVAESARIGEGSVVMANAVINPDALVERGTIINTAAVIEHDNVIDQFVHISPGALLAGNVTVSEFSHVGIGTSIIQGVRIGSHCIIGAGSTVLEEIPDRSTAVGTPAKVIKHG